MLMFNMAQVASIALVQGCDVATKDSEPFRAAGLVVLNPWGNESGNGAS
jgi:hypothetical protein